MKKLSTRFFGLLMAVNVLFAATGVTVFSHICKSSGHKDVSVLPVEHCCTGEMDFNAAHASATCLEEAACCQLDAGFLKAEVQATSKGTNQQHSIPFIAVLKLFTVQFISVEKFKTFNLFLCNAPPDGNWGRTLLTNIQVFRI